MIKIATNKSYEITNKILLIYKHLKNSQRIRRVYFRNYLYFVGFFIMTFEITLGVIFSEYFKVPELDTIIRGVLASKFIIALINSFVIDWIPENCTD